MVFEENQAGSDTINVKYSKIDGVIKYVKNMVGYKTLLYIVILFISSSISLFGVRPIPLVMLGVATVFNIPLLIPVITTILSMVAFGVGISEMWFFIVVNIVYTISTVLINIDGVSRKTVVSLKLAISTAIVSLIYVIINKFDLEYILDKVMLVLLVQALYYVYVYGFYGLANIDKKMIYSTEEIVSMAILATISFIIITNVNILGLSLWVTVALILSIMVAYTGGISAGISSGIVIGLIVGIITKDVQNIYVIATCSLVASLLNRVNKFLAMIGVVLVACIVLFAYNGAITFSIELMQVCISAIAIIFLPKKITVILEDIFNKNNTLKSAYEKELGVGSDIKNKLSAMSEVFDNLSTITLKSTEEDFTETKKVLLKYLEDYKEMKCLNCNYRYYCMKENMDIVTSYIARKLEANEQITETMLPVDCNESKTMIKEIKDIYNNMKLMRIIKQKESESNIKLANEYKEIAKLIKNMSKEVVSLKKDISYNQKCIRQELRLLGYKIYEDNYNETETSKMYEFITDILEDVDIAKQEIQTIVSQVLGQNMHIKLILNSSKNEKSRIKLISDSKYIMNSEVYQKTKQGSNKNGDSYIVKEMKDRNMVIAISDGMGSGDKANEISKNVIATLEKCMNSGFSDSVITDVINSTLKLNDDGNMSATLDMTIIDQRQEKVSFLKLGSAPTYIVQKDKVTVIDKDNMPLGLENINSRYIKDIDLEKKMIIINISDGAYSDRIKEYLNKVSKENIDIIRENDIIKELLEFSNSENNDDITIIVTKVE